MVSSNIHREATASSSRIVVMVMVPTSLCAAASAGHASVPSSVHRASDLAHPMGPSATVAVVS